MEHTNKNKTKAAIFIISMILQSMNTVALVISGVAKSHPEASITSVQLVYTLISLIGIPAMLAAGKLVSVITKKKLAALSCLFMLAGGLIGYFFSGSLMMLYVASAFIGFGNSILSPTSSSLIAAHFEGDERASLMGIQSLFVNGGAILLNLLAGYLGRSAWNGTYLLFFVTVPVILAILFLLPEDSLEKPEKGEKVRIFTPYFTLLLLQVFLFGLGYMTFMTNIAVYVDSLGEAGNTSLLITASSVGCVLIGLVLPKVMHMTGKYCFATATALGAAALWLFCVSAAFPLLLFSSLLLGLGFGLIMPAGFTLIPETVHPGAITMAMSLFSIAFGLSAFLSTYIVTMGAAFFSDGIVARFTLAAVIVTIDVVIGILTARKFSK